MLPVCKLRSVIIQCNADLIRCCTQYQVTCQYVGVVDNYHVVCQNVGVVYSYHVACQCAGVVYNIMLHVNMLVL